jgi:hypothetical protein
MSSGDKWTEEEEAAIARFVRGEDSAIAFVAALTRLEMDRREAERAAHEAEATLHGREP